MLPTLKHLKKCNQTFASKLKHNSSHLININSRSEVIRTAYNLDQQTENLMYSSQLRELQLRGYKETKGLENSSKPTFRPFYSDLMLKHMSLEVVI